MYTQQPLTSYLQNLSNQHLAEISAWLLPPTTATASSTEAATKTSPPTATTKTPSQARQSSKEELISRLAQTIENRQVQARILSTITQEEGRFITAIAWLKGASLRHLIALSSQLYDWHQVVSILSSLEKRLIILYQNDTHSFYINPHLEHSILTTKVHWKTLSPATPLETPVMSILQHNLWLALIAACHGLAIQEPLSTRTTKTLQSRLQALNPISHQHMSALVLGLQRLGIITQQGMIHTKTLNQLATWNPHQRNQLLLESMLSEKRISLQDIWFILPPQTQIKRTEASLLLSGYCTRYDIHATPEQILEELVSLGILQERDSLIISPSYYEEKPSEKPIITGELSFAISPETPWATVTSILAYIEPTHTDTLAHFTLTKESFLRAITEGVSLENFTKKLGGIFPEPILQNIAEQCQRWNQEFRQFVITRGVLLEVSAESQAYMNLPALQPYILEQISESRFFMDIHKETEWTRILTEAGVSHIHNTHAPKKESVESSHIKKPQPQRLPQPTVEPHSPKELYTDWQDTTGLHADRPKAQDTTELLTDQLNTKGPGHTKNTPLATIAALGEEVNRVSGPDYQQKVHITHDAIRSKHFLYITLATVEGEEEGLFSPIKIVQENGQSYLQAFSIPDKKLVHIGLRKVFSLVALQGYHWMKEFLS